MQVPRYVFGKKSESSRVPFLVLLHSHIQLADLHGQCGFYGGSGEQMPLGTGR